MVIKQLLQRMKERINNRVFANEGEMNFLGRESFVTAVAQIQHRALAR